MTTQLPIDRETIRQDISKMAFREVRLDRSLNIDHELGGDEIQSILDRLCEKYDINKDEFWSKIDFDSFFFHELNVFEFVFAILKYNVKGRSNPKIQEPFMIDDIVRIMRECRRSRA